MVLAPVVVWGAIFVELYSACAVLCRRVAVVRGELCGRERDRSISISTRRCGKECSALSVVNSPAADTVGNFFLFGI